MHPEGRPVQAEAVDDARFGVNDMELHNGVAQKVIRIMYVRSLKAIQGVISEVQH